MTPSLLPRSVADLTERFGGLTTLATTLVLIQKAWSTDKGWWQKDPELLALYDSQLAVVMEIVPKGYQIIPCMQCGIKIFTDFRPRKNAKIRCPFGCRRRADLDQNRIRQMTYRASGNRRRAEQRKFLRDTAKKLANGDPPALLPTVPTPPETLPSPTSAGRYFSP